MKSIRALFRPPAVFDVLAIAGLLLLAIGLWMIDPSAALGFLGAVLIGVALRGAAMTPERQHQRRGPRRGGRLQYLGTERTLGRESPWFGVVHDRGELVDDDDGD